MAQYKTGSVNVTNGSATVTGVDTLWSAEVSAGDIFTIVGDNAWYEVGSVGSNTSITLTSTYAGSTASGAQYAISRDFTTNKSIPYPQKGDIETASLLKRAMNIIDNELSTGFDSSNVTITGGTINGTTIGGTTAAAVSATTLTTSSTVTHNGGTANSVCFLNGSKVLTTGSALTFDGTNLGVGVASPGYGVDLRGASGVGIQIFETSTGNNNRLILTQQATVSTYNSTFSTGSGAHAWQLGGTEQMRLTSTGLGIGTSSPTYKLDVVGFGRFSSGVLGSGGLTMYGDASSGSGMLLSTSGNLGLGVTPSAWGSGYKAIEFGGGGSSLFSGTSVAAQTYLTANAYFNGTSWIYKNTAAAAYYEQLGSSHRWYTAPSGTAGNAITFTQALSLTAAGNLLLGGTTDPGGTKVLYIGNGTTPGTPTSGGVLYVESGALKYKGSSGTVTTLGAA